MKDNKEDKLNEELEELKEAGEEYNDVLDGKVKPKKDAEEIIDDDDKDDEPKPSKKPSKDTTNYVLILLVGLGIIITLAFFVTGMIYGKYKKDEVELNNRDMEAKEAKEKYEEKVSKVTKDWSDSKKDISGLDKTEKEKKDDEVKKTIENKTTTDDYKKYEKLPEKEKEKQEVVPRKEEVPENNTEKIKDDTKNVTVPAKYDLRDNIKVQVEDQGKYGTCWAFASMKSLETNLALTKKQNKDYSEEHLFYLTHNIYNTRGSETLSNTKGGSFGEFEDYNLYSNPVDESLVPYGKERTDMLNLANMDGDVVVTDTIDYPTFREDNSLSNDENYQRRMAFVDIIKKHIMTYGSLYAVVYNPGIEGYGATYMNGATNSEYWNGSKEALGNSPLLSMHAVSIIGFDDTYSKDNFKDKPAHDGAFLALNSWGTSFHNKGVFYISYEDKMVLSSLSGVTATSLDDSSMYDIDSFKSNTVKKIIKDSLGYSLINKNNKTYVSKLALKQIKYLDLSNKNLTNSDLDELKVFEGLNQLNLSNNNIDNIDALKSLKNLFSLDISNNKISDLSTLSGLSELFDLNASNNNISDVTTLSSLTKLDILDISGNRAINGVTSLKHIGELDIRNDNITDIDLSGLTNLFIVDLSKNDIGNIKVNNGLYSFICSNCDIDSISELNLPSTLTSISLSNNDIESLDGIDKFKSLVSLNLSNNKLTDISKIEGTNISNLDLSKNKTIKDYSYLNNIIPEDKIKEQYEESKQYYDSGESTTMDDFLKEALYDNSINLDNNDISDVTPFKDVMTGSLSLKNNKITDISGLSSKYIQTLYLDGNKGIKGLESLKYIDALSLADTDLKDLTPIYNLKNITVLDLSNNDLKDITDINKLDNLITLNLSGNKNLKGEIDLSKLFNLDISNTNYNDFNDIKCESLSTLNISKIDSFKNIDKYLNNNVKYKVLTADDVDLTYLDLDNIGSENTLNGAKLKIKATKTSNTDYNIDDLDMRRKLYRDNNDALSNSNYIVSNGTIGRHYKTINTDNDDFSITRYQKYSKYNTYVIK